MIIQGIKVDDDVLTTKFACDYSVCKGACCSITFEGIDYEGCEVTRNEAKLIYANKSLLAEFVSGKAKDIVRKRPIYKKDGEIYVSMLPNGKCCLECGHCALNTAKREGVLDYGNPIACILYPLVYTKKDKHLEIGHYYDDAGICKSGYEKGAKEGISIVEFCKDGIVKALGTDFYQELVKHLK